MIVSRETFTNEGHIFTKNLVLTLGNKVEKLRFSYTGQKKIKTGRGKRKPMQKKKGKDRKKEDSLYK